jgi:hypothetical protein
LLMPIKSGMVLLFSLKNVMIFCYEKLHDTYLLYSLTHGSP